ncbi:aromatic ring-hydroxylating dioxygenase subunit alpha [Sphingobium sp. AN558]|uniref:aromatic ring-hydroxylating oxygenase subunit alpha n=1 Tax=Sphingobium sp. AN558 TaxID=3133442 RepID=UPI0030BA8832
MDSFIPQRPQVDYLEGIRSYDDVPAGSVRAKAPYIDNGTDLIDPRRYRDPAEAVREWDKLWTKVWNLAGIASDIPNRGDWFKYDLGKESFLIVRGDDDQIRAFYNVCPHRGNQMVRTDFGTANECFSCAFHGWKFGKDGSLLSVKEPETFRREVLDGAPGLTEVRCDVWGGIVFINMDDDAGPLLDFLSVIPDHLAAYRLENYRVVDDVEYIYDANWKTSLDAFVEFYHADQIHPELGQAMETYYCQYDLYPRGVSRMILPLGNTPDKVEDRDTPNEVQETMIRQWEGDPEEWKHLRGADYKQAMVQVKRRLAERAGWTHCDDLDDDQMVDDLNYLIFPNVTTNTYSDVNYLQIFRPHPTDPMKCIWRSITLVPPAKHEGFRPLELASLGQGNTIDAADKDLSVRPPTRRVTDPADTGFVLEQDALLVPGVQRGIESRAFKGYRLSEQEIRIRHYLAEVDRYLAR